MSFKASKQVPYKSPKEAIVTWNTWRKGLNSLLRENEIDASEVSQSDNIVLIGSGAPTKRWGSQNSWLAGTLGSGRMISYNKDNTGIEKILAITDGGILSSKNGASYTEITGVSWPSGYNIESTQLGNVVYFVSQEREFAKYNFTTLSGFATLATPTGAGLTNVSQATGLTEWSWRITAAASSGGETLGSTAVSLMSLPQRLDDTLIRIQWTPISAASGILSGYNIYRGSPGNELWAGGVGSDTTVFDDYGQPPTDEGRIVPRADNTGGHKAKYILRFQDRLVLAGIKDDPTAVVISGRWPQQESFDWTSGGGNVFIEPDSGDEITGLATYYQASTSSQTIIVFKENSVWEIKLGQLIYGQYSLLNPTYRLLTASQGCSSHRSIRAVENDIMFSNRKGIYILRYEPQLTNVINANEISAKIRPFFEARSSSDLTKATAIYADKKYILSFPGSKQSIVFDRERLSFIGPWITPFGIAQWENYVDSDGTRRWVCIDSDDAYVSEFQKTLSDDKGEAINTLFKTRREDFGDWTVYKTINEVFMNFNNILGSISVNIYIEDRKGNTIISKTFTLTSSGTSGTSGMGTELWGGIQMGLTDNIPSDNSGETPTKTYVYKSSRIVQIEVRTTGSNSNYELLGTKIIGIPQSRGNSPSSWNTS